MAWVKLDDAILDNHKIIAAGPLGFALHIAAITWCGRNLTDGFIPKRRVPLLLDLPSLQVSETTKVRVLHALTADDLAADLERIGLWHDRGEQWEVHDYLEYNPSKSEVLAERARHAENQQRSRARKTRDRSRDRSVISQSSTRDRGPVPVPVPVPGEEEQKDLISLASLARPPADGFDEFWTLYPRHEGKAAARKAWRKLCPLPPLEAIRTALEWQRCSTHWLERGGQFIPHPATYLNGRRWEDEPPSAARAAFGWNPRTAGNAAAAAQWLASKHKEPPT